MCPGGREDWQDIFYLGQGASEINRSLILDPRRVGLRSAHTHTRAMESASTPYGQFMESKSNYFLAIPGRFRSYFPLVKGSKHPLGFR